VRNKRHQEILNIIKEHEIPNQRELTRELRTRGFPATQPTVSRDISRLGLRKALTEEGVFCYSVPEKANNAKLGGLFMNAVYSVDTAMNTVVIKTHQGMASAVCVVIETMSAVQIVGTIAGDDTIFIMTRSVNDAADLAAKLKKLL